MTDYETILYVERESVARLLITALRAHGFTPREISQTQAWLRSKGNSIEGGTSEVNLNVVAKRVLGLLDHQ